MSLRNRGTSLIFILLLLAYLEATEHQVKFKDSHNYNHLPKVNGSTVFTGDNVRLKKMHNSEIEKLIAGSAKSIRPRPPSSDNRAGGSASRANNRTRESNRSLATSINKSIGEGKNSSRTKYEKKKQSKLLNMRKSQQRNVNYRTNNVSPIRGCSSGIKGTKKGHACHNPGRKVKRFMTVPPGAEVIQQWNTTCIIPIPAWLWSVWTYFG